MMTANAALAAISAASLTYIGLSLALANIKSRAKRVGGITFIRVGSYQLSVCKPRAAAISADRMTMAAKRAQSREAKRLDEIAREWCNG